MGVGMVCSHSRTKYPLETPVRYQQKVITRYQIGTRIIIGGMINSIVIHHWTVIPLSWTKQMDYRPSRRKFALAKSIRGLQCHISLGNLPSKTNKIAFNGYCGVQDGLVHVGCVNWVIVGPTILDGCGHGSF
jgi:hypothetical protein